MYVFHHIPSLHHNKNSLKCNIDDDCYHTECYFILSKIYGTRLSLNWELLIYIVATWMNELWKRILNCRLSLYKCICNYKISALDSIDFIGSTIMTTLFWLLINTKETWWRKGTFIKDDRFSLNEFLFKQSGDFDGILWKGCENAAEWFIWWMMQKKII